MTNKKKRYKNKDEHKNPSSLSEYKTKEERQEQVKNIISEINRLGFSIQNEPIKDLYMCLRRYVEQDTVVKINIPFPDIERTIIGELKVGKKEECVVCFQANNKQS